MYNEGKEGKGERKEVEREREREGNELSVSQAGRDAAARSPSLALGPNVFRTADRKPGLHAYSTALSTPPSRRERTPPIGTPTPSVLPRSLSTTRRVARTRKRRRKELVYIYARIEKN